jgi:hypothetical protein
MMLLNRDYFNYTLAGNETIRRLFLTGMVSGVAEKFSKRITQE